jgi:hypothetical protein
MFTKMIMFAASIASRGFLNKKTDIQTKQLRVLSCFGGTDIESCPFLKISQIDKEKHFCDKCGCGDKPTTWLVKNGEDYSKLDYPVLNCPMKMPGFTNYDPNFTSPEIKDRKQKIEKFDPDQLYLIQVTVGKSEEKERLMEQINKVIENS